LISRTLGIARGAKLAACEVVDDAIAGEVTVTALVLRDDTSGVTCLAFRDPALC
jgi:hypothetical protein